METQHVRTDKADIKKLEKCKKLYLEHHPDMKGVEITNAFIISKIIEFYLEAD